MKAAMLALAVLGSTCALWAEEPVYFVDPDLKAAVERELFVWDPTPTDMLALTEFSYVRSWDAEDEAVTDLTGLEYAVNLQALNLRYSLITDISVLSHLSNLERLNLSQNRIRDVSALSGLSRLTYLNLHANQISDLSPLSRLDHVDTLVLRFNEIGDISALSGMTRLQDLDLGGNQISDLGPLSSLEQLSTLCLWCNHVSDLSPLSGLAGLRVLNLDINHITDIGPLSGLSDLRDLDLASNGVSDLSPLCALTALASLDVRGNPLPQEVYELQIPLIIANNPGIDIDHDAHAGQLLSTSSTLGGSVLDPGEGEFTYDYDAVVRLEAGAEPGFVFAGWSGTYPVMQNPVFLTMDRDYQMRATFVSPRAVLHVDATAFGLSGPGDPDGTAERPFGRIQEAIVAATEGASIIVEPGTYRENIDLVGKNIRVIGMDPNHPGRGTWPVIEAAGGGPVVRFTGGLDSRCVLTGFVITAGIGTPAGAILCEGAGPTMTHCLIVGNRSLDPNGAIVYCHDSQAVLINCTIADDYVDWSGATLMLVDSDVTVRNSIFWNSPTAREILAMGTSNPDIQYCAVRGWWPDWGNIHEDPLFARHGYWAGALHPNVVLGPEDPQAVWVGGDYHPVSQAGRWDPDVRSWTRDAVSSPCIDAGLGDSPVGPEPTPNGGCINMGAYGGTAEASKSTALP